MALIAFVREKGIASRKENDREFDVLEVESAIWRRRSPSQNSSIWTAIDGCASFCCLQTGIENVAPGFWKHKVSATATAKANGSKNVLG